MARVELLTTCESQVVDCALWNDLQKWLQRIQAILSTTQPKPHFLIKILDKP